MRITLELVGRKAITNLPTMYWEFVQKPKPPDVAHARLYMTPVMWQEAGRPVELVIELPDTK
jgi:hypothetical protein